MAKQYNEITNQAAVERVNGRTIAFYPNLEAPTLCSYGEGVTGKVKVSIQDYTKGKGDNSFYVNFNLELSDIYFLFERAKISNMPEPLRRTKIIGWEQVKEGKYKGLSATSKLVISRTAKTSDGKPRNYPWDITIQNGYAKALPGKITGTFYEASGTFQVVNESSMKFTDVDFLEKMMQINNYIKMYNDVMVKPMFTKGLSEFLKAEAERKNRNSYSASVEQEVNAAQSNKQPAKEEPKQMNMTGYTSSTSGVTPYEKDVATGVSTAEENKTSGNSPNVKKNCHKMTMVITSPFQYLDGERAVAQCMIGGKVYNVMFKDVDDALIEAQEKRLAITCLLYADEKKQMYFDSIAA